MQDSILVITPQAPFGELIRQSLEETGRYRVEVAYQAVDALARCRRQAGYRLVILDGDLPGSALEPLIQEIRAALPEARIAAIPSEDGQGPLPQLDVDGTLSKPFYLPSLAATVERLITGSEPGAEKTPLRLATESAWPEDEQERLAWLADVVAGSGALGGLLLADGRVLAAAGSLAGEGSADLLAALSGRLGGAGSELILYLRTPDEAGRVMVYGVDRGQGGALLLVFAPEVEYSRARARVREAVRT